VASILQGKGVDPSVLDITYHGEYSPLVPTGDQVPEPRNRRVEITVR
jgi:outer membrane protein OmpA-like peptidoglycan-associated protein